MSKVKYERVDEEGDYYKRILARFNPHFLRGADFEIVFVPIVHAYEASQIFVKDTDSMSTIDLHRWAVREHALRSGLVGTHVSEGYVVPEPRQIISGVKRVFEFVKEEFSESTAYIYNYFIMSGQLGSLPFVNEDFSIGKLRVVIEGADYPGFTAEGEIIRRPLVEHLFDTHKTEYIRANILRFLEILRFVMKQTVEEPDKKQRQ